MLNLWFIQVRVTFIHHFIQKFTTFPYAHLYPVQFPIFFSHFLHLRKNK
ncbi:hypothetical protein MtrunA17_Chr8g0341291 [Medicago truncatula]|uniref:Uncharacterized protein n=1 Tax=Medicago truncatula TaxID=3880 RepID=A0A396GDA3_MEDTR|nr:hypothetical protein MtrunA17_Chr8g0341291 [Medicago truncatula]